MALKRVFHPRLNRHVILGGRKRPTPPPGKRMLHLKDYLAPNIALPTTFDKSAVAMPSLTQIFLNDSLGDCVIAGGDGHSVGTWSANTGTIEIPTNDQIIQQYHNIGGYNPGDPTTDQGCDEQTAMSFWTNTGFWNGKKLICWVKVDGTSVYQLQVAAYLFGNVLYGGELPDTYVQNLAAPTWGPGTPDPSNGHCVMTPSAYNATGMPICTWGEMKTWTYDGIASICVPSAGGECYSMISPEWLSSGQTKAPNGVDWNTILADAVAMGGTVPGYPPPSSPPGS